MSRTITINQTAVDLLARAFFYVPPTAEELRHAQAAVLDALNKIHTAQNGDDLATLRDLAAQMDQKEKDQ